MRLRWIKHVSQHWDGSISLPEMDFISKARRDRWAKEFLPRLGRRLMWFNGYRRPRSAGLLCSKHLMMYRSEWRPRDAQIQRRNFRRLDEHDPCPLAVQCPRPRLHASPTATFLSNSLCVVNQSCRGAGRQPFYSNSWFMLNRSFLGERYYVTFVSSHRKSIYRLSVCNVGTERWTFP